MFLSTPLNVSDCGLIGQTTKVLSQNVKYACTTPHAQISDALFLMTKLLFKKKKKKPSKGDILPVEGCIR